MSTPDEEDIIRQVGKSRVSSMSTVLYTPEESTEIHIVSPVEFRFSCRITADEARRQKIAQHRNWFAVLALILAAAAVVCVYTDLPYQPFVATCIATVGIVVVLAMKAAGK